MVFNQGCRLRTCLRSSIQDGESEGTRDTPFFITDSELWEPEATPPHLRSRGVRKCWCLALLFYLSCCQVSDVAFWQQNSQNPTE